MKKKVAAGILAILLALEMPVGVWAAEAQDDFVQEAITAEDSIIEDNSTEEVKEAIAGYQKEWKEFPYKGRIGGSIMSDYCMEMTEEMSDYDTADEIGALNAYKYSAILPSSETLNKYVRRGDVMKLHFNLFCRGVSTDKYYIRIRKGSTSSGGKTGKIVGYTEGSFDAEECMINMTIDWETEKLSAGTYTVETYMRYKSGSSYVMDSSTHYYFNVYVTDSKTLLKSVAIDTTGKQMEVGEELTLEVTYSPKNTTEDTTVTWSNSNPVAVKVEDGYYTTQAGTLTALDYGTSYITAHMGSKTAVCIVTVSPDKDENFPFSDVVIDKKDWKYNSIKYVNDNGIMNGIAGTSWFEPNSQLTRAMFATVLYRMAGSPEIDYKDTFADVTDGRYYSDAIIWAYNAGIVSGMGDGTYGVEKNITREQIAKMLNEYARVKGYDVSQSKELDSFTDVPEVSGWATDYLKWATAVSMINGKPNEDGSYRLDPKGEATRVECAKMLMMFEKKYGNGKSDSE